MPRPADLKKKQFGQNLNKLVVKPPPVVGSGGGVQRNGLLLLSATKKEGGLLSTPSANTNAGAAAKLHESTIVSTHDALLSAVTGKVERDAKQLDAWGVAADKHETEDVSHPHAATQETAEAKAPTTAIPDDKSRDDVAGSSWDDYGGRGADPSKELKQTIVDVNLDQQAYMSKLAKERAARVNTEESLKKKENEVRAAARLKELDEKSQKESQARTRSIWEPSHKQDQSSGHRSHHSVDDNEAAAERDERPSENPVIHLSSYEDRSRGEVQTSSAPRMLYDPKSGSMVAVKIREEKKKLPVRKPRKDKKPEAKEETKKTLKPKKEISKQQVKKLPRTCGVLYERDATGQIRCADGCDGDLGYGAHSVPGGKLYNPGAYAELMKMQDAGNGATTYNSGSLQIGMKGTEVSLQTGLMGTHDDDKAHFVSMDSFDFVTADDKLELVTGVDDSPTLKPTAKEWAPSQAAIAAIVASRNKNPEALKDSDDDEEDDEGYLVDGGGSDCDDGPVGLGFDPTQDMDGLMNSPPLTAEESHQLTAAVDIDALKIDPPIFSLSSSQVGPLSAQSNIFAFGTSGTWGTKSSTSADGDDWAMPAGTSGAGAGLFGGMNAFTQGKNDPAVHASPFLGGGTWTAPTQR